MCVHRSHVVPREQPLQLMTTCTFSTQWSCWATGDILISNKTYIDIRIHNLTLILFLETASRQPQPIIFCLSTILMLVLLLFEIHSLLLLLQCKCHCRRRQYLISVLLAKLFALFWLSLHCFWLTRAHAHFTGGAHCRRLVVSSLVKSGFASSIQHQRLTLGCCCCCCFCWWWCCC